MKRAAVRSDERKPRLLIPDTTPISLLAMAGDEALDWLFLPGIEVWVTDMVQTEACRDPGPDADARTQHRAAIKAWFERNSHRLRVHATEAGSEYRKAMLNWEAGGRKPELKPSWRGRGDVSVLEALRATRKFVDDGETVIAIVDDKDLRDAIAGTAQLNVDLLSTQGFISWVAEKRSVPGAATAWDAISRAAAGHVLKPLEEDPLYIRKA